MSRPKGWEHQRNEYFAHNTPVKGKCRQRDYEAGADAMKTVFLEWVKGCSKEEKVAVFTDGKLYTTTIKMFDEFFEYPKEELDEEISDGLGSVWSAYCPVCKEKSMSVVRPGKVQCENCG